MLVLTRKVGERVIVGGDIVITVVEVDRGKVRIGIDAPKGVPICREELARFVAGRIEQRAEAARPFADGGAE